MDFWEIEEGFGRGIYFVIVELFFIKHMQNNESDILVGCTEWRTLVFSKIQLRVDDFRASLSDKIKLRKAQELSIEAQFQTFFFNVAVCIPERLFIFCIVDIQFNETERMVPS